MAVSIAKRSLWLFLPPAVQFLPRLIQDNKSMTGTARYASASSLRRLAMDVLRCDLNLTLLIFNGKAWKHPVVKGSPRFFMVYFGVYFFYLFSLHIRQPPLISCQCAAFFVVKLTIFQAEHLHHKHSGGRVRHHRGVFQSASGYVYIIRVIIDY